jgi:hypothetical protein
MRCFVRFSGWGALPRVFNVLACEARNNDKAAPKGAVSYLWSSTVQLSLNGIDEVGELGRHRLHRR